MRSVNQESESAEEVLFRLASREDVPGFRDLASTLGEWVSLQAGADPHRVIRWDDVYIDRGTALPGVSPWATLRPEPTDVLLAAAWCRFHDRLLAGCRRHPWPPWMVGDGLVDTWLGMSGVQASPDTRSRGRAIADDLGVAVGAEPAEPEIEDLRSALAEREKLKREVFELAGHISGLERTLRYRDQQLRVREDRIRGLRGRLDHLEWERSGVYVVNARRVAWMINDPADFAKAGWRRLRSRAGR